MVAHLLGYVKCVSFIIGFQTRLVGVIPYIHIFNQLDESEGMLNGGRIGILGIHLITAQVKPPVTFQTEFTLAFLADESDEAGTAQ